MVLIVMLAAIAAMVYLSAAYYQKSHIIEIAVRAVIGFFSLYVVVSGLFFLIDQFNMLAVLVVCILIELAAAFLLWKRGLRWKALAVSCALRPYAFVLCVAALAVLLSLVKYDFFGMGQDQGVYQTKAIEMIYNSAKNQLDFEEYKNLTDPADKLAYQRMLPRFTGFYTGAHYPTFTPEDKISDVSGYYHGIPTFAAMLALFGKCFGWAICRSFKRSFLSAQYSSCFGDAGTCASARSRLASCCCFTRFAHT